MELKKALVSVVVCTYNGGKFLNEQLETICNQTYPNLEVLILDDGSIDNTVEIAKEYEKKYSFVRVIQNDKNLGINRNMEYGFSLAKGVYICPADQDDVWKLNKIEILVALIEEKKCSLVYCNAYITDENLGLIKNKFGNDLTQNDVSHFIDGKNHLNLIILNCVSGHAMLFEKELSLTQLNSNDIYYDQWLAISGLLAKGIHFTLTPLVYFRRHQLAQTNTSRTPKEVFIYLKKSLIVIQTHPKLSLSQKKYIGKLIVNFENNIKLRAKIALFFCFLYRLSSIFRIRNKSVLSNLVYARKLSFRFYK